MNVLPRPYNYELSTVGVLSDSLPVTANLTTFNNMTPKIKITREGYAWAWLVKLGNKILFGGYCWTKADALNDATIALVILQ